MHINIFTEVQFIWKRLIQLLSDKNALSYYVNYMTLRLTLHPVEHQTRWQTRMRTMRLNESVKALYDLEYRPIELVLVEFS